MLTAVKLPERSIEAIIGLVLDHAPPPTTSPRVTVEPMQIVAGPVITAGAGNGSTLTVTVLLDEQPPLVAVTLYVLSPATVGVIVWLAHAVQASPVAPPIPVHENEEVDCALTSTLSIAQ
jgi:hypothetical protein